jgi:superfamily I DNA and/or RNA helicase
MLEQEVVAADDIAKSLLIITPYRAQRSLISNRLEETRWIAKMQIRALVTTVHRAQGSEREYVILDVTDAPNFDRDVFLPVGRLWEGEGLQSNGSRLLNTALTRARKQALVVLHRDSIRNSSAVRSGIVKALPSLNDKLDRWGMPATIKFDSPESKEC